jgi:putative ABC transport system permease protein
MPVFNDFLDADMTVRYLGTGGLLLPIVVLVVVVGAAGGLYPAFYLSRFQPAKVLKANKSSSDAEGTGRLRNILVVSQFAVSIGLIVCTGVIYAQTVYARTVDPGYKRDGLLQIQNVGADEIKPVMKTLKQEMSRIPGVRAVALTGIGVNPGNNSVASVYLPGNPKSVDLGTYAIEPDFIPTMDMKLLAGRNFSESIAMDDATTPFPVVPEAERAIVKRGINVVMTELAVQRLGFKTPAEAIGKQINSALTYPEFGLVPTTIVGVVKDARFRSVRDPLQPIMYYYATTNHNALMIRFEGIEPKRIMSDVENAWKRVVPTVPFTADFVDDRVKRLYERDEARGQLFAAFAILAVVIGCLGLFGLAAFTAERRTKEIGIRKVLGARTRDIVRLLAWQFSKPVLVANLIAWPVAWWVMRDWLNNFDARITLGPTPFVLAGALALAIALGTIGGHAFRVARANPINALRYE